MTADLTPTHPSDQTGTEMTSTQPVAADPMAHPLTQMAARPAPKVELLKPTTVFDRVGFGSLVKVEMRKFLDTRAGAWLLGIGLASAVGIALICAVFYRQLTEITGTSWTMLAGFVGFGVQLLVPVMVILMFTTEWTQRTTLTTFSLEPRRGRVVAAKGVVAVAVALALWLFQYGMAAVGSAIGGAVHHIDVDWSMDWKILAGSLAAYIMSMAMAAGFGMLFMNTAAAIVTYMALPMVVSTLGLAGSKVQAVLNWVDLSTASVPLLLGEWKANDGWQLLTASLIWVVLPVVLGTWRYLRTEAK
ncbi:hypothetical protein [Aestuariimicrobium ganziense]|uniref:hypothetical protein n=1 Tax=Aestuariimicrobium ganziense TaxID=2773677 RepID=UPI001940BE26|nr:hypothetical protein [Aestuariimicrobium ganziense]